MMNNTLSRPAERGRIDRVRYYALLMIGAAALAVFF